LEDQYKINEKYIIQKIILTKTNIPYFLIYQTYFSDSLLHVHYQFFLKENVRYLEWTCRAPIFVILWTWFSLILWTQIGSLKHLRKTLSLLEINRYGFLVPILIYRPFIDQ